MCKVSKNRIRNSVLSLPKCEKRGALVEPISKKKKKFFVRSTLLYNIQRRIEENYLMHNIKNAAKALAKGSNEMP